VERKGADSFYQRPDVTLQPAPWMDSPIANYQGQPDPQTGQPTSAPQKVAVEVHQELLNNHLGEHGIDAIEMMDAVVFDIICTQAVGFTKMGYESYTKDTPQVNPLTGEMVSVPVPILEQCFWEHFSGKQAIIPASFRSTQWDKAPFLGMAFELPLTAGNRKKYHLPDDFTGAKANGQQHYDLGDGTPQDGGDQVFTGVEIWYRSILYREDISHPEHLTQLVLIDGLDVPAIERDSPYQTVTPTGGLTPDSLIGFPIHPFSVRTLTDSAYLASDATMIRPLENELDTFRTQSVQFRDASILRYIANGDVLPADALNRIVRSPIGGITVVPSEAFVGDGAIKPLEGGSMPRDNFQAANTIDNDMARTTAIDGPASGVQGDGANTATESQIASANANARADKERARLLKRYISGATKFSTLLQRYLPVADAVAMVGPQRAQLWDAWRKQANGRLAFTAMPDSALRVDQAVDRKQAQDLYSFLANDPYIQAGRPKLLEKLLRKFHIDPVGIVAPPPPPKPQPPSLAFSFKGEDLVGPQAPIVLGIAQQLGLQIDPSWVTLSQAALQQDQQLALLAHAKDADSAGDGRHGGKLAPQESLSKHAADVTGGMQGTGAPAALGAAGGHLQ
jgi:hypothetical protein